MDIISHGINIYCPLIKSVPKPDSKNSGTCPWYSDRLVKLKNKLFYWHIQAKTGNIVAISIVKSVKREYRNEITKAKKNYNDSLIGKATNKNKMAWNIIRKESTSHKEMIYPNTSVNDIYNHFVNNIPRIGPVVFGSHNGLPMQSSNSKSPLQQVFNLKLVSQASIILAVKNIKSTRSEDIFGLSLLT